MGITVNTQDLSSLNGVINQAIQELGSPEPLLKVWAVVLQRDHLLRFQQGGTPQWKPLAPSTQAGKRKGGGGLPLQSLRSDFDVTIDPGNASVTLGTNNPIALFHQDGTKGPYKIEPKSPGGVLALPFFPERDAGKGSSGSGKAGRFSLKGLGGAKAKKGGGFKKGGKTVRPFSNLAFYRFVMHPGLPARPMLPTVEHIEPLLLASAEAFLAKVVGDEK